MAPFILSSNTYLIPIAAKASAARFSLSAMQVGIILAGLRQAAAPPTQSARPNPPSARHLTAVESKRAA